MLKLNHPLLSISGILSSFNKDVLNKKEPSAPAPSLLMQLRTKLKNIYFPKDEVVTGALIEHDARFRSNYPELKMALKAIFESEDKEAILAVLKTAASLVEADTECHLLQWKSMNSDLGYFADGVDLLPLFGRLAEASRAMSALVEQNLSDEKMPYIYAYRLMVLFAQQMPIPSFDVIAQKTEDLLKQANVYQKNTPYHDVILNQIQLPRKTCDLSGWLKLIRGLNGIAVLKYFAMAPEIEYQIKKELGIDRAPLSLAEAKAMAARCYYQRGNEHPELAELCQVYHVPEIGDECSFNKCLDYLKSVTWPMKERDNLPMLEIMGQGAAEGYCWVKLPTDDLRALILGRLTSSCQNIGGKAEACVKDAVSLANNGLYVLLKRKPHAPHSSQPYLHNGKINNEHFEIVGQSYAWISTTGNLVLDSLECSIGRVSESVSKALLTQFAEQVLALNHGIKWVTLGANSGTQMKMEFPLAAIPERMRSGYEYGDSMQQYCIARTSPHPTAESEISRLDLRSDFKDILLYLSYYLTDPKLEKPLKLLLEEHSEVTYRFDHEALFRLLAMTSSPTLNDLRTVNFDTLDSLSKETLAEISSARMVWQATSPELLARIFPYLSEADRFRAVKLYKETLFQCAKDATLLKLFLGAYPEAERLTALKERGKNGGTVLHYAAQNPESLQAVLAVYPEAERLLALKAKDKYGQTVLHSAVYNSESLKMVLAMYPEAERLTALKEKDKERETVLHYAVHNPASLQAVLAVLAVYPESERLTVLKNSHTVLHRAASDSESLKMVLAVYPESERLLALKEKDKYGQTVLHSAVYNSESLKMVLAVYPESEQLLALKEKDKCGRTVLHCAVVNSESLKMVLAVYPESSRLAALKEKNIAGDTVLHSAVYNSELLQVALAVLVACPESERLAALKEKNINGDTVLHCAAQQRTSLEALLAVCPESGRLAALKEQDRYGRTVLHLAVRYPELLQAMLAMYPESERLAALKEQDELGMTVLRYCARDYPESLKAILGSLPQEILTQLPVDILEHRVVKAFIFDATKTENCANQYKVRYQKETHEAASEADKPDGPSRRLM